MRLLLMLMIASAGWAATPPQVTRSQAERDVTDAHLMSLDSAARVERGLALLNRYPDDIPAGKEIQIAVAKLLPDARGYFRERYERLNSATSFYLYARAENFEIPEELASEWVTKEPNNSFLWLCYMAVEWHKTEPDPAIVRERIEQSIVVDPSRPEGYNFLGMFYDEQGDRVQARAAYESALACDPADDAVRSRLLDLYLSLRDAQAYFALINGVIPEQPLDVELATIGSSDRSIGPLDFRGQVSLLVYWSMGSEICINTSLVEINKAIGEDRIKWPVYAVHVGGDSTDAEGLISETDRNGTKWRVNFVESATALDVNLNTPHHPCVYVVGADGYVHALVHGKGHEADLIDTVIWLSEQVQAGM
ncbi:MAG: hypothetical protein H6506_04810 [Calditrichaeota bacterium]|nr:hypothetical protein [Calditrichota bacterium]MCB9391956.1 hypothetical protein [Calditrichota bacterium]